MEVPNPFSGKRYSVSLKPVDVAAIVFWSKNYHPFLPVLEKIRPIYQDRFLFHFTINGFQDRARELFEPNIPDWKKAIDTVKMLSKQFGMETVLWRFDPIIFSSLTPSEERLNAFKSIAQQLEGSIRRCYISFVDLYGKVRRRFESIKTKEHIKFKTPGSPEQVEFVSRIKKIASDYGIALFTCCENDIADATGIERGRCIDSELLQRLYPQIRFPDDIKPTRRECGCFASRDIGSYDSCQHYCLYCYANK